MTTNQAWRYSFLKCIFTSSAQPVELNFFHQRTSDIDSKKWLLDNGLDYWFEDIVISAWYEFPVRKLTFIWIGEKQNE